jgi:hypothetical protein
MSDNGQVRIDIVGTDSASPAVGKVEGSLSGLEKQTKKNTEQARELDRQFRQTDLSTMNDQVAQFTKQLKADTPKNRAYALSVSDIKNQYEAGKISAEEALKQLNKLSAGMDEGKQSSIDYAGAWKKVQATVAGVAAGLAAAGVVVKGAFDLGLAGAKINQQTESFKTLLSVIGAAPDLLQQLRDASRGTITDMGLMSSTAALLSGASDELARSMAKGAPQILAIADAANKLNPTLGSTEFLYQSLMTGIKRGSPLLIDNTGLTVRLGEANEAYAKKLGKTVEQLTEEEKKQALLNGVLEAGDNLLRQVGGSADSMTDPFERLSAATTNLGNSIKSKLAPGLAQAAEAATLMITRTDTLTAVTSTHFKNIQNTGMGYKQYTEEIRRVLEVQGLQLKQNAFQGDMLPKLNTMLAQMGYTTRILSEAEFENVNATYADVGAYQALQGVLSSVMGAIGGVADATNAVSSNMANLSGELSSLGGRAIDVQNDLATATQNLNDAQANFSQKLGGDVLQALKDANVSGVNYDLAIQGLDSTLGTSFKTQEDYNKKIKEAVDQFKRTGDVSAFQTAVSNLQDQFGPLTEEIAKAQAKVDELKAALDRIDGMRISVLVDIQQNNGVTLPPSAPQIPNPNPVNNGGGNPNPVPQATGGPMRASQTYLMNEYAPTRPETVVQGVNGAVLTKQDAMQALKGGGGKTINIYINGQDAQQTANLVVNEIRRRL